MLFQLLNRYAVLSNKYEKYEIRKSLFGMRCVTSKRPDFKIIITSVVQTNPKEVVPILPVSLLAIYENAITSTDRLCTSQSSVFPLRAVVYFEEHCSLQEYQHKKYHISSYLYPLLTLTIQDYRS
jgi:hypothetical protein